MVRLWHLDADENYVLTLFDFGLNSDKINHIKYENKGKLMVAGTKEGRVVFWKNSNEMFSEGENWQSIKSDITGPGPVK